MVIVEEAPKVTLDPDLKDAIQTLMEEKLK